MCATRATAHRPPQRSSVLVSLLALTLALAMPRAAQAAWSEGGMAMDRQVNTYGTEVAVGARSDRGDLYFLVQSLGNCTSYKIPRVTVDGGLPWGLDPPSLGWDCAGGEGHIHAIVPDSSGGCYFVGFYWDPSYTNYYILAHVLANGTLEAGPHNPLDGPPFWPIDTLYGYPQAGACSDGAGGLYIAWQRAGALTLQRRTSASGIAAGWDTAGRLLAQTNAVLAAPSLLPDGNGGVVILWTDSRPRAIHILSDGSLAPGWSGPIDLSNDAPAITGLIYVPKLLPSGPNALIAVWTEPPNTPNRIVAQRFGLDGLRDPAWPSNGLQIVAPVLDLGRMALVSDGQDGIHALWETGGLPRWAHVLASGAFAPGFSDTGMVPLPASAHYFHPRSLAAPYLVGAAGPAGGLAFAWADSTDPSASTLRVRWMKADGMLYPGEPDSGRIVPLAPGATKAEVYGAEPDGVGGIHLVWQDWNYTTADPPDRLWINDMLPGALVPVLISLADARAGSDGVHLHWRATSGGSVTANVYRRTADSPWTLRGRVQSDGQGDLRYDDAEVTPGERYGYRLGVAERNTESWFGEAWVTVPRAPQFSLAGFTPNPSGGVTAVAFALPLDAPARLEMFDVTGRRVLAREVGALGAGTHTLALEPDTRLRAGVYLLRLTQGSRSVTARGVVTR